MMNSCRRSTCAESEAVLEGAGGIAVSDPLLLRILEVAELNVGALPHVLGIGAHGVLQLLVVLVQELIGFVGRTGNAGFIFWIRMRAVSARFGSRSQQYQSLLRLPPAAAQSAKQRQGRAFGPSGSRAAEIQDTRASGLRSRPSVRNASLANRCVASPLLRRERRRRSRITTIAHWRHNRPSRSQI